MCPSLLFAQIPQWRTSIAVEIWKKNCAFILNPHFTITNLSVPLGNCIWHPWMRSCTLLEILILSVMLPDQNKKTSVFCFCWLAAKPKHILVFVTEDLLLAVMFSVGMKDTWNSSMEEVGSVVCTGFFYSSSN